MMTTNRLRIFLDILLLIAFFFLPWWALFLLALPGLSLYPWFGEVLVLGFALDVLFHEPSTGVTPLWMTLLALALLFLSLLAKRGLRLTSYVSSSH
ncbi:hypothetical protein K8Q93_02815 [Candidatus Parcubacteria bacterium]|nr:hypothetical protein [Candidatus Parcubacteria bacterium]